MKIEPSNRREALRTLAVGGVGIAAAAVALSKTAAAEEVALDKTPASIKKAAHQLVKGAKWEVVMKHKEDDGHEYYELYGTHDKGLNVSVEVAADGKVTSVELQIDLKDVPKAALSAVSAKLTAFKPDTATALYAGDGIHDLGKALFAYQLHGTAAKGKDLTVEVTAEGKIVEVKREIELGDVPKGVSDVLANKAPKFKPDMVHRITRDDKVAGFLFASKHRVAWLSHDGKEFEIHKED
jgi:hypothetical protein